MTRLAPFPAGFDLHAYTVSRARVRDARRYSVHAGRVTNIGRVRLGRAEAARDQEAAGFVCPYCEDLVHPEQWRDHLAHCVHGRASLDPWRCSQEEPCPLCTAGAATPHAERLRIMTPEVYGAQEHLF